MKRAKQVQYMSQENSSRDAKKLNQLGAISLFTMPLCYLGMFLIFGVLLSIPQSGSVIDKIEYLASHKAIIGTGYTLGYLIFGGLLSVAVQAIHYRLKASQSILLNSASLFGVIWVVLMMCSGMLALVGMNTMINLFSQGNPQAETLFYIYTTVVNGLGGGIELVGGAWVLGLSVYGIKTEQLGKGLNYFGCLVGILGVGTLFQSVPGIKEAFGLCQIIWFIGMGRTLHKS